MPRLPFTFRPDREADGRLTVDGAILNRNEPPMRSDEVVVSSDDAHETTSEEVRVPTTRRVEMYTRDPAGVVTPLTREEHAYTVETQQVKRVKAGIRFDPVTGDFYKRG